MSRTLHVIDQPGQTAEVVVLRLSLDAARQDTSHQHAWLLFGGEPTRDAARAVGLRDEQYCLVPKPTGLQKHLPLSLARPRSILNQAHRVVCWTEGATQIVSLLGCANVVRRVEQAGLTEYARQIIVQAHQEQEIDEQPDRQALREKWGVERDTTVVAMIGDRFEGLDASAAMTTIILTHEALLAIDPDHSDVRLLCHPLMKGRIEAVELISLMGLGHLLIQDASVSAPWSMLSACDSALVLKPADAGLSMLWADACGVPIFTPQNDQAPMLSSLSSIVRTRRAKPSDMADTITQWLRNSTPVPAG